MRKLHFIILFLLVFFASCNRSDSEFLQEVSDKAYSVRYKSLPLTEQLARDVLANRNASSDDRAEALNTLAFVMTQKMRYDDAFSLLDSVDLATNNEIELLIADVQRMRLTQRKSESKEFYRWNESAERRLSRIAEEENTLTDRQRRRCNSARNEMALVQSTYFYYIGLEEKSHEAIAQIEVNDDLEADTATWLAYLYIVGSGGMIHETDANVLAQREFDHLMRCFLLAQSGDYRYWQANAMQAISEHLQDETQRDSLMKHNMPAMKFLNPDNMPDSLLAGYLAQKAYDTFRDYGDVYQTAGALRTLAQCFWLIGDSNSASLCLEQALHGDTIINQAPDLVASIHEQLSVVYSSVDDKPSSDFHRNHYIDMQERTRQDRYLESRADQLRASLLRQNIMLAALGAVIVVIAALLLLFNQMRKKRENSQKTIAELLKPLQQWQKTENEKRRESREETERIGEEIQLARAKREAYLKENVEQRAKITLSESVIPLIERMINEVQRVKNCGQNDEQSRERTQYIDELNNQIISINDMLTDWIRLDKGRLNVLIETFKLQDLFDIVSHAGVSFQMKGIDFRVNPTADVVKADKALTLFMINTLVDNARKFTPEGGKVVLDSRAAADYIEVSIADNGSGMTAEEVGKVFSVDRKIENNHGYGLINCRGIVERYKKISRTFSVASIGVESEKGRGSRFFFRLPKGILHATVAAMMMVLPANAAKNIDIEAARYADSMYIANISGNYQSTINYADSAIMAINKKYRTIKKHSNDTMLLMKTNASDIPAEIVWWREQLPIDYKVILDIRNECAVAALALHQWKLYEYNNAIYTQLYKETSADENLKKYVRLTEKRATNRRLIIVMLTLILLSILPAYYLLYYRHLLYNRFCADRVRDINNMLLSTESYQTKLSFVDNIDVNRFPVMLKRIVNDIRESLKWSIENEEKQQELMEKETQTLQQNELEASKLHISNCCISNTLSSLKHETMYYPAKITQLLDTQADISTVEEIANYYKTIYDALLRPSKRFAETSQKIARFAVSEMDIVKKFDTTACKNLDDYTVLGNIFMLNYCLELIFREAKSDNLRLEIKQTDNDYLTIQIRNIHNLQPTTSLICRQILRDMGEMTHRRGCGLTENIEENIKILNLIVANGKKKSR